MVRWGLLLIWILPSVLWAQSEMVTGKATPAEVVQKVRDAARFVAEQGGKGLAEIENPQGRFVWKDSFVWATECATNSCLPTPRRRDLGVSLSQMKCQQTGKPYVLALCDEVAARPQGAWVEHWQPRPGFAVPQRKVSFMLPAPGTPYQVVSEIFDATPLDELYRLSNAR